MNFNTNFNRNYSSVDICDNAFHVFWVLWSESRSRRLFKGYEQYCMLNDLNFIGFYNLIEIVFQNLIKVMIPSLISIPDVLTFVLFQVLPAAKVG